MSEKNRDNKNRWRNVTIRRDVQIERGDKGSRRNQIYV